MGGRQARLKGPYRQKSVRARIEAFFLDNLGKIVTREQIIRVATDPTTRKVPENWHQRLSELRTDKGYTILSWRNRGHLKRSEYLMPDAERRSTVTKRMRPHADVWKKVLLRADFKCAWTEGTVHCGLQHGDIDPIGGGTVRLTPDHRRPHAVHARIDPNDPSQWQPLCGRHQVMKKNYWDDETGWLNVVAIVQSASEEQKHQVLAFLREYFKTA